MDNFRMVRSERSQLAAIGLISFNFFYFAESVYPSLYLRLYPRSTKIVADKLEGRKTAHVQPRSNGLSAPLLIISHLH
jgi:hypothetical protein